jgi:hypothetical protein
MGWASTLTYEQVAATGIVRSLRVLAFYGDVAAATEMLRANSSLADDPEALAAAAENGHEAIVHLLLRYQPRLAERVALVARTRDLTECLFRNGMNPNLKRWLGVTPLHGFAQQGDVDKASIFLDHAADLKARDEEFCTTPLGYAALFGKQRMVRFLLRRGAKPHLADDLAWATPVALAIYKGHHEIVRVLTAFEATGFLPGCDLESISSVVDDLIVAYNTGDADSFVRVIDHFDIRRPMAWDRPQKSTRILRIRRFARHRLDYIAQAEISPTLDASDAQLLVARSYGFGSWTELEKHAGSS